jgi:hypothetical protein
MNQNILMRLEKKAEKLVLDISASLDCDEYTSLFNEKFAELIVQECQSRVEQYIKVCGEIGCLPDTVIKKHFGVEE